MITIDIYSEICYNNYVWGNSIPIAENDERICEMQMNEQFTILKSGAEVRSRIRELAAEISADYAGISAESPLLLLCTLSGAVFFSADLVRELTVPCEINFLKVHSYQGIRPAGSPIFDLGENIDVRGRHVLIVEDIVDTGQTMHTVMQNFTDKGAADIRICTMLDKPSRRYPQLKDLVIPDYTGFEIEDLFVIGWGLDYNQKYRLLPDIMVYHPEAENGKEQ